MLKNHRYYIPLLLLSIALLQPMLATAKTVSTVKLWKDSGFEKPNICLKFQETMPSTASGFPYQLDAPKQWIDLFSQHVKACSTSHNKLLNDVHHFFFSSHQEKTTTQEKKCLRSNIKKLQQDQNSMEESLNIMHQTYNALPRKSVQNLPLAKKDEADAKHIEYMREYLGWFRSTQINPLSMSHVYVSECIAKPNHTFALIKMKTEQIKNTPRPTP